MKNLINDLWDLALDSINPIKSFKELEEKNKFLKPFAAITVGGEMLESIIGFIILSPFKFVFWITQKR